MFLILPFAVSFSVLYIYISHKYINIIYTYHIFYQSVILTTLCCSFISNTRNNNQLYIYIYIEKQDKNSMMSWSTNFIITFITQPRFSTTLSPSSLVQTTEEGDRVVENLGCVINVIIKFVDQDH